MDLNNQVNIERSIQDTTTKTLSLGVYYSPLMMESAAEVLLKEERHLDAIQAAVSPTIFLQRRRPVAYIFWCF
jgi:hypothetical protein